MATYPVVEDADAPLPRAVHIRSTAYGQAEPGDSPALCGIRPRRRWLMSEQRSTCCACLETARGIESGEVRPP
jgi:hypothetical protein